MRAGLFPYSDYVIGADTILHESEDFFSLIEAHNTRPLKLYVYNCDTDKCRDVTLTPDSAWGGEGSLGCGIGYGYLHRIPHNVARSGDVNTSAQSAAAASVEKPKKTIAAVLGIDEQGSEGATINPSNVAQTSNVLTSNTATSTSGLFGQGMQPVLPISSSSEITVSNASSINQGLSGPPRLPQPTPAMSSQPQTITTPLSIPGRLSFILSARIMQTIFHN